MTDSKLLSHLTIADLQSRPCWKHYLENDDEYVLAIEKNEISETDTDYYIVLTEFILKDRTRHTGFSSPQDTSGLDYIQPVIVTANGHFPLYLDNLDRIQLQNLTNEILNRNLDEVFPLTFVTQVICDNKYFRAQVDYFNVMTQ